MRTVLVGGVVCLLSITKVHGEVAAPSHRVAFGGVHGALRWSEAPFDVKNPVDEAAGSLAGGVLVCMLDMAGPRITSMWGERSATPKGVYRRRAL